MNYTINVHNNKIYRYKYVWTHRRQHILLYFCKCVEDNKHIFKNKVLMRRIHKCRIVDILTETQYIEMYERMRNKQIEAYNKYMGT